jgi:hypothetical protein
MAHFKLSRVPVEVEGGCRKLPHRTNSSGYVQFSVNGKLVVAHRFFYEEAHGPLSDELDLDHLCHNADKTCRGGRACPHRACVNLEHLEPATPRTNGLRGVGPQARNALKVACPRGHPLSGSNLMSEGPDRRWRRCRACKRDRERSRKKEQANAS